MPVYEDDGEPEWEISGILDRRRYRGKYEYLVQYVGYPLLEDCEWRPHAELKDTAPKILADFEKSYNKKPSSRGSKRKRQ